MGACATKPKVLKEDDKAQAQAPAPEPAPEQANELADLIMGAKEVFVYEEGEKKVERGGGGGDDRSINQEGDKVKEIVDDDKADEQGNKRKSLSHLFSEKEGKETTESKNTASEPEKQKTLETGNSIGRTPLETGNSPVPLETGNSPAPLETVKQSQIEKPIVVVSVTKLPEAENSEIPDTPDFVDAPEKIETEKVVEATPAIETQTKEVSEEKKIEAAK